MPPKAKVTKRDIVNAAVDLVRESGAAALNARAAASRLDISTQPIFSHYSTMDELRADVIAAANGLYQEYLRREMASGDYPDYKASGMAYIRFAKEEKELFKLLFMRDRTGESVGQEADEIRPIIEIVKKNTGMSEEKAFLFHLEMWIYVHGIATMLATSYLEWDWELISRMLTDAYFGLRARYCGKDGQ